MRGGVNRVLLYRRAVWATVDAHGRRINHGCRDYHSRIVRHGGAAHHRTDSDGHRQWDEFLYGPGVPERVLAGVVSRCVVDDAGDSDHPRCGHRVLVRILSPQVVYIRRD